MQKLLTFFFSKNISVYVIFEDQRFNDMLTNDIVGFEQLGPGVLHLFHHYLSHIKTIRWYSNALAYVTRRLIG